MNHKMAKIHIYRQLNLKKNLSKQEQRHSHNTERVLMVVKWEGCGEMGEEMKGLKITNR